MARNRQRAKQRQAERRARRLQEQKTPARPRDAAEAQARAAETVADGGPAPPIDPSLVVGAPPEDEGRSDTVLEEEPALDEEHLEEYEVEAEEEAEEEEAAYAPRGRRGRHAAERAATRERSRVVQFLVAVWAELQRVEWPNRQALTTLTGVVLGFVLIAGGYLGLLDAIFSKLIQAII